ncbi:MAG: hypothetical protein Q4F79_12560 [Eubacteriales bacterium]|nr:hypothetical protein [Eubacteriales bacterium]
MSLKTVSEMFGITLEDGATAEEIEEAFSNADAENFVARTDYDSLKLSLDKATSDASRYKKEARELRAAARAEPSPVELQLAELQQQLRTRDFSESLMDIGFTKADALAMSQSMFGEQDDHSSFFRVLSTHIDTVRKATAREQMVDTPAPAGGAEKPGATTPEQFKAMSAQDKQTLFDTNPDAFRALSTGQSVQLT